MRQLIPALLMLAMLTPASASHCATYSTTVPDVTIDGSAAGEGTYYVDDLCAVVAFVTNHLICGGDGAPWVYEESNGLPGLQRGDEVVDDTCHGMIEADTIIF